MYFTRTCAAETIVIIKSHPEMRLKNPIPQTKKEAFFQKASFLSTRQNYRKTVTPVLTLCPNFPLMLFDNAFRDGEPQTKATISASSRIRPIKPLEDLHQLFFTERWTFIDHLQNTMLLAFLVQRYPNGPVLIRIFAGIIQQNIHQLPKLGFVSGHMNFLIHLREKFQSFFKKNRFKSHRCIVCQLAEVYISEDTFGLRIICSHKFQHLLNQIAHLAGHSNDPLQKAFLLLLAVLGALQQFRIGHNDRQRSF